nr:putative ribonuclease H-like domain-containing protein [Tanacetum cinerariifolium]
MIGNISYLSDFEPFDGGYVSFGQGGYKITGKGTIKTGKLEFKNVYFVKDLKYNLFIVSQICDNRNSVLFIDSKCIVLRRDFKLLYDANILLKTPRQHNMYSIDLNNIVPYRDLSCLVSKASSDECYLWHMRLGHLNFKIMNKLVRHNLVRGLPTKCFKNDHNCTACLKGKQHKASCKSRLVTSVSKPLHTLHMDLFGLTFVSSISYKWYCLVVTDDFSRFTWTFFLKTKDETSGILRKFITKIENLKDLKVKIIRCDNGGEFRNKELNDFCTQKGIKRVFSNARTPQQNGVAERRNRSLIEATRTMLADAKLPVTFRAEAVNIACYVQNRVLVNKAHNKTPYELFNGRTPSIGFLKPFRCYVMILNTLENLGKFEPKGDESYFLGYSMSSKAFRVFNKRTKRVEENVHIEFLENKAIEKGSGPNWLFDIDSLTKYMNYVPVLDAGTNSTNFLGTKVDARKDVKKDVSSLRYIVLPKWVHEEHLESISSQPQDPCSIDAPESSRNSNLTATSTNPQADQVETLTVETPIPTVSSPVPTVCFTDSQEPSSETRLVSKRITNQAETPSLDNILTLTNQFEDTLGVATNSKESNGVEADGNEGTGKDADLHLYRSMIRSLMYLTASRPDIIFAVCACARHQVTPKEYHLHAVKRIFRYLKGHPRLGLWYPKDSPFDLVSFLDSDYGGATQDRKSTTGGCQFLGRRLISWQCKKQTIMATLITEAEYVAAASCCGQVLCIQNQLLDYGLNMTLEAFSREFSTSILRFLRLIPLGEHNSNFHPMVDFLEASPLRRNLKLRDKDAISSLPDAEHFENLTLMGYNISPNQKFTFQKGQFSHQWKYLIHTIMQCLSPKSTGFNEFSSNIATALVCLATNRTYNFSKMIFDGLVKNINNKGEGSRTPTEPHHTPSPVAQTALHTTQPTSSLPPVSTTSIPNVTPTETTPIQQYTQRSRIAQSSSLPPVAYEPASPMRDVSQGEACPTDSGFIADQDRVTIAKSSTLPHDSTLRVTSPVADEGIMQPNITELTERVNVLEDKEGIAATRFGDDAPIKGRSMDEAEAATERISDDTEEMAMVLTSIDAATVLAGGIDDVPTGSGFISTAGSPAADIPTGSDVVPTASLVFSTATVVTPYSRRKGKE